MQRLDLFPSFRARAVRSEIQRPTMERLTLGSGCIAARRPRMTIVLSVRS